MKKTNKIILLVILAVIVIIILGAILIYPYLEIQHQILLTHQQQNLSKRSSNISISAISNNSIINNLFPKKLNNSNFSLLSSFALSNTQDRKIGNFTIPQYRGYNIFYVNGDYVINVAQFIFNSTQQAKLYFNNSKSATYSNISKTVAFSKNISILNNLPKNMFGINQHIDNVSNYYSITSINGSKVCSATLSQYTSKNISSPTIILISAIKMCFQTQ